MNARHLWWCGLLLLALPGVRAAACDANGCGLGGARGAMSDDSAVEQRPLAPDLQPTLPAQGERMLPVEHLVLWGLDMRDGAGDVMPREVTEAHTVILKGAIPYLRFESGRSVVSDKDVSALKTVLDRLSGKHNVRLHIIGHTDSQHLSARSRKLYGNNYGLGLDRAKRVGRVFIERLGLAPDAVTYDSKGDTQPLASNSTPQGMALNRRVEVEVWYDELSKRSCDQPVRTASTVVLRDAVPPLHFDSGHSAVSEEDVATLRTVLKSLAGKANVRLHIIGYTDNQRLTAHAKSLYHDNYGLGLDRAHQVGRVFMQRLGLPDDAVTYDSKGDTEPLAPNTTAKGMALNRRVEVQVLYDEFHEAPPVGCPAPPPPQKCPGGAVAGNGTLPFRVSVDGQPVAVGDTANSADVQRCVDVGLERNHLQVHYDNLSQAPRLDIAAGPRVAHLGKPVQFQGYSNYLFWIDRAEVRIYGTLHAFGEPQTIAVVPLSKTLSGAWTPPDGSPSRVYYRLRVYDAQGRYDETEALPLDVLRGDHKGEDAADAAADLASAYGGSRLVRHDIPVAGGTITVNGIDVAAGQSVYVMGRPIAVDPKGAFAAQQIIPRGLNTIEVAVLDKNGHGKIYRRDLRLPDSDWFYVGIADFTVGENDTTGPAKLLTGDTQHYNNDTYVDGRLAFYTKGKVQGKYTVTASADTGAQPFGSIFSNFNSKDPQQFLRRLDANQGWSVFGDDSTLIEDAPTDGRFYAKIDDGQSRAMWGNFKEHINDTKLTPINRSLYGAEAHYGGDQFTAFGERKLQMEGFAAQPGTASAREDFRGTGGSVYFLHYQDITAGSEQVWIEIRDKDSGMVLKANNLVAGEDYTIDPIQGRILLNKPLPTNADDSNLVRAGNLAGNPVYLVVSYEYSPGLTQLSDIDSGGRVAYWLNDTVKVGVTTARQGNLGTTQDLNGADITLRKSAATWLKLEGARSNGGFNEMSSSNGGFDFSTQSAGSGTAAAGRAEAAFALRDLGADSDGKGTLYVERRGAGFSAPGSLTGSATDQFGGSVSTPIGKATDLGIKYDQNDQVASTLTRALDANIAHHLDKHWTVSAGLRADERERDPTFNNGHRDDLALQAEYASTNDWATYGFVQNTVAKDGDRSNNGRAGIGGRYRANERTQLTGEVSGGDLGPAAKAGVNYAASDRTNLYLNYLLDPDNGDSAIGSRRGEVVTGAKSRWSDTTSVYAEERYQNGNQPDGLMQSYGVDYAPNDRWSYGLGLESGKLTDASGVISRGAVSSKVGYSANGVRYGGALEYRKDNSSGQNLTVWLVRNNYTRQVVPDWRAIARLDFAVGDSSLGDVYNGDYVEASLGYAYRPIANDRLNALVKYTYLADLPPPGQASTATGTMVDYAQRSHVAAVDIMYDLTARWSVGGKYAIRVGELRLSRDASAPWFSSTGQLFVLRADWHVVRKWDMLVETRRRDEFAAQDSRIGALLGLYRDIGEHFKLGVGYNFANFSDNLTDLSYRNQGWFLNAIGKI